MEVVSIVSWEKACGLKSRRHCLLNSPEWFGSPVGVLLAAKEPKFPIEPLDDGLPTGCAVWEGDEAGQCFLTVLNEPKARGRTTEVRENIPDRSNGVRPEGDQILPPALVVPD